MKKISLKSIAVLMMIVLAFGMFMPTANAEFPDLRPDHWCYEKITDFEERGYVTGYDDGEFKPDRTITRAEYVTIVNNFFGYEADTENTAEFLDVSEDDWFEPYVSEAVKRGYISGYPDGTFKPHDPIRRQEATIILAKIIDIHDEEYAKDHEDGLAQYEDGDEVDEWAYKAVHSYSVYNFINGYEDNTIRLFRNVSRAETVQLLNTVEEKVVIDRDNKTNEIKDKPSRSRRVDTPIISVIETNDDNTWYNGIEAGEDDKVTVKVTTTTSNASITVKVNGVEIQTTPSEVENGSEVRFELADGEYEITSTADKSGYRTSYEAKLNVKIDTKKPVVSGKINEEEKTVSLYAKDNLSGIDNIQYAWFILDGNNYVRVSNWENISDNIAFPTEPQNYYIGIKGSDLAGNKIDGGLKDSIADVYDEIENPDGKVTDKVKDEPYDILKEIIINEKVEDKEGNPDQSIGDKFITFHKNDGTDKTYRQNIELEGDTTLETGIFSREEYTFIGWAEAFDGNKVFDDGAIVNFTENKDLYAVWKLNESSQNPVVVEIKVTVTFDPNGGTGEMAPQVIKYGEIVPLTANTFEKVGYTFGGWAKSIDGEKVYDDATNYEALNNETLYAIWNINQYTITFNTNGGSTIDPITQDYGTEIVAPADPTKPGYTFAGWDTEIPTTMPAENITITATWTKDGTKWYTVTFVAGDNGTFEGNPQTVYEDILNGKTLKQAGIVIPKPVGNTGYEFDSWTPSTPDSSTIVNDDLIYTANFAKIWEAPDVTIKQFKSTNVSNEVGNRAEPETVIEYEIVITNNEEEDKALIDIKLDSDMVLVSPGTIENITLKPRESITLIAKKTVPGNYKVAGDAFEAEVEVFAKNGDGVKKRVDSEIAKNKIEKTVTVKKGEPVNKNIVMTIDFSGSMLYCCSHDKPDTSVNEIFSVIADGKTYKLCNPDGELRLRPNHYYREDSSSSVLHCEDMSRIRALQLGFDEFVDKLYSYYQENDVAVNIDVVLFAGDAKSTHFVFGDTTKDEIKEWFEDKIDDLEDKNKGALDIGSLDSTNINAGIAVAKETFEKYKYSNGDTYSIYFGDGAGQGEIEALGCNDVRTYAKNGSYVIGFGPFNCKVLKENLATANELPYVLHAWTQNDIVNALSDITDEIILNEQSSDGIIQVEVDEDGKFYPIIATYDDGSEKELFNITTETQFANNSTLKLKDSILSWNIKGYTGYNGLKIHLGENLIIHDIHDFGENETCGTCKNCGIVVEHIPEIRNAKEATCTEKGYTGDTVCTVCDEVIATGEDIEALDHDFANENCGTKCSRCEVTVAHDFGENETCGTCSKNCGTVVEHITEVRNAKEATCTEKGYTGDTVCTVCGETIEEGEEVPVVDHNYVDGECENCGAKEIIVPEDEEII